MLRFVGMSFSRCGNAYVTFPLPMHSYTLLVHGYKSPRFLCVYNKDAVFSSSYSLVRSLLSELLSELSLLFIGIELSVVYIVNPTSILVLNTYTLTRETQMLLMVHHTF